MGRGPCPFGERVLLCQSPGVGHWFAAGRGQSSFGASRSFFFEEASKLG